jgi:hypothetical protein
MEWKCPPEFPQSGQRVLVIKQYLIGQDDIVWSYPEIHIDSGWHFNETLFRWEGGGKVLKWMELPSLEELENEFK